MSVAKSKKEMQNNLVYNSCLCRFCGAVTQCRVLTEEYDNYGRTEVYADMVKNCFGIQLSELDGKATDRLICIWCVHKLRSAFDFKTQVKQSEKLLLQNKTGSKFQLRARRPSELMDYVDEQENDGLDDELDADQLKEYYALERLLKAAENLSGDMNNTLLLSKPSEVSKPMRDDCSSDENVPLTEIRDKQTKKRTMVKRRSTKLGKSDLPYLSASNTAIIVRNSYACPFTSRFNHIKCYYCKQHMLTPAELREHAVLHDVCHFTPHRYKHTKVDISRIDCRLCPEKIDSLEEFTRHISSVHKKKYYHDTRHSIFPFKLSGDGNKCVVCHDTFPFFYSLSEHVTRHFSQFVCHRCGMAFIDEQTLQKHVTTHDSKRYPCDICKKSFKSDYYRILHTRKIHEKDSHGEFCSVCEEFLLYSDKSKHMVEVHGTAATVPCHACDQSFKSRRMLTIHVRKEHMKDFRYSCNICGRKFFVRSALNHHMPTHTGERNFKCKVCGKTYPRLKTLQGHMRIHNNDRRYKCKVCDAAFVQNCSLKGHMKSKHPEYTNDIVS